MGNDNLISSITQRNKLISEMNIQNYLRTELGIYGFAAAEQTLIQIQDLASKFSICDLGIIPKRRLDSINNRLTNIGNLLTQFLEYDRDKPKHGTKEQLIENLETYHNDFFNDVIELVAFFELNQKKLESTENKAQEILKSLEFMQNEVSEKKSNAYSEAEKILKGLKDISAESGVTQHSRLFANEAKLHHKAAKCWLGYTFLLVLVSIGVAYLIFQYFTPALPEPTLYQIIQFTLIKLLIFSILYYLLVLFIKNYNAHRHNYIINKHRQNALSTFQTFVNSTKDQEIKNAVLLQTTQSIFSNQISGYLKHDSDDSNPNKIIEIFRNASSIAENK